MREDYASKNVYWLLIQVASRAKHGLMRLAEKHDLTMVQLHTLGIMKPGEPLRMNMISCILLCDASNVTGIVDRLLAHGYIVREEMPEDRRVKMISLTPKGEMLRRKLFEEMAEYEMPEFKRLSEHQKISLHQILSVILEPPHDVKC